MTYNHFKIIKVTITALIAGAISISIQTGNWYLPGISLVVGAGLLWTLKQKVRDITEDERDRKVAGKAALIAMSIYSVGVAVVGTTLVALGKDSMTYYIVGSVLLYGAVSQMVLYAILFKVYAKKTDRN